MRRPGVAAALTVDLALFQLFASFAETLAPALGHLSLAAFAADLRSAMASEVDFRYEARRLTQFRAFLATEHGGALAAGATAPLPYDHDEGSGGSCLMSCVSQGSCLIGAVESFVRASQIHILVLASRAMLGTRRPIMYIDGPMSIVSRISTPEAYPVRVP